LVEINGHIIYNSTGIKFLLIMKHMKLDRNYFNFNMNHKLKAEKLTIAKELMLYMGLNKL